MFTFTTAHKEAWKYLSGLMSDDANETLRLLKQLEFWLNDTTEKQVVVIYGTGNNGKSTFMNVLNRMTNMVQYNGTHQPLNPKALLLLSESVEDNLSKDLFEAFNKLPNTKLIITTNSTVSTLMLPYLTRALNFGRSFNCPDFRVSDEVVNALVDLTTIVGVKPQPEIPEQRAAFDYILDLMGGNRADADDLLRQMKFWLTDTTEKQVIILYGHGNNGKTKFLETLGRMKYMVRVNETHMDVNSDDFILLPEPDPSFRREFDVPKIMSNYTNTKYFMETNSLEGLTERNYPHKIIEFKQNLYNPYFELSDGVVDALYELCINFPN